MSNDLSYIDHSDPAWPREVEPAHVAADDDHAPTPVSAFEDGVMEHCSTCGYAVTSDGRRHGFDA